MDSSENLDMYHDFADKLTASKKSVEVDESLRLSYELQQEMTEKLKIDSVKGFYENVVRILYLLGLIVFASHIIFKGVWIGIVGLLPMGIFFIASKIALTKNAKKLLALNRDSKKIDLLKISDVNELRNYNLAIINFKLTRYQLIRAFSVVITPLIFLAINEIVFGNFSPLNVGLAILLGSFFWMVYFHENIDQLKKLKERAIRV